MNDLVHFGLTSGAALGMGMLIGLERQYRQHTAGLRTNALVTLGAAMFVSLSHLMVDIGSPTRIASYIVSGIGFLGGGVILREGLTVRGMNTAATLWCSAAVGTLAGSGYVAEAALGTLAVLLVNILLRPVVGWLAVWTKATGEVETSYRLRAVCADEGQAIIRAIFLRHINSQPHMSVQGISTHDVADEGKVAVVADIFSTGRNDKFMNDIVSRISIEPTVSSVSWEKNPVPEIPLR